MINSPVGKKARQIALLGSSGDIATSEELEMAERCGYEIARRGLVLVTAGDDGVMGSAAKAAKHLGGTVIAVLPRDKGLTETWIFDSIVDTGMSWVQFSDVILRSCLGALVVGGGAGTIGELAIAYMNDVPVALVGPASDLALRFGGKPLDVRGIRRTEVFDTPHEALDYVITAFRSVTELNPGEATQEGVNWHDAGYPYGKYWLPPDSSYLRAAEGFRIAAALLSPVKERSEWAEAISRAFDALGEHSYYHVEDFLQAASWFVRARSYLVEERDISTDNVKPYLVYLDAIILECVGKGLFKAGSAKLAKEITEESAKLYEAALEVSPDFAHLRYSSLGLRGSACVYESVFLLQSGRLVEARTALKRARELKDLALNAFPAWGEECSSDNYQRDISYIASVEAEIDRAERAKTDTR